ncbi:MAG: prenyltransferase/squalene oxidase repeat-containing protein, partial [Gemmataceae bacterium]
EWVEMLTKEQNPDGTFGMGDALARETGGKVACLLRLGGTVKDADRVVKALDAAQREDGGFGVGKSDLETSYRVVRAYHMLEHRPAKSDALKAFIARCRNDDGGYGVAPGQPSSAGGTYFAGILLHWLAAKP